MSDEPGTVEGRRWEGAATLLDSMDGVRTAVTGYRASLLQEGFTHPAAETMAVDFHRYLLNMLEHAQTTGRAE